MKLRYRPLGDYILEVNNRDRAMVVDRLLGVSIQKKFIPSIANTIGTDMSTYKIVKRNQFAYGPVTSRNGDQISIALLEDFDEAIVSQAYITFEIKDTNELLPEYLMMWFRRPEFDRYARFKSHGSAREIFSWQEMRNTLLPIPSIQKQKEVVDEYNAIRNQIIINNRFIENIDGMIRSIYKKWFIDFEFPDKSGHSYIKNNGAMVWNEKLGMDIPKGWGVNTLKSICTKIGSGSTPKGGKASYHKTGISLIRSTNIHDFKFSSNDLALIDERQAKELDGVSVSKEDILFNITGVSVARCCKVPSYILPARVNQHVMIIRPYPEYNLSAYLLCLLCYSDNKSKLLGISQSGSTREAITKEEIEAFEVLIPDKEIIERANILFSKLLNIVEIKTLSNNKLSNLLGLLLSKLSVLEN